MQVLNQSVQDGLLLSTSSKLTGNVDGTGLGQYFEYQGTR